MQLTIGDITAIVQYIDITVKRGVVEGGELMAVAQMREKLVAFANAAAQAQALAEQEAAASPDFPLEENE